jgi:hypothetical protein
MKALQSSLYDMTIEAVVFDSGNVVSQFEPVKVFRDESGQWFARGTKVMAETGFFTDPLSPQNQGFLSRLFGRYTRAAPRVSDPTLHGAAIEGGEYLNRAYKVIKETFYLRSLSYLTVS